MHLLNKDLAGCLVASHCDAVREAVACVAATSGHHLIPTGSEGHILPGSLSLDHSSDENPGSSLII